MLRTICWYHTLFKGVTHAMRSAESWSCWHPCWRQIHLGIKKGILVFLGVEQGDRTSDADYLSEKIIKLEDLWRWARQDGSLSPRHKGRDACRIAIHAFGWLPEGEKAIILPAQKIGSSKETVRLFHRQGARKGRTRCPGAISAMMFVELITMDLWQFFWTAETAFEDYGRIKGISWYSYR